MYNVNGITFSDGVKHSDPPACLGGWRQTGGFCPRLTTHGWILGDITLGADWSQGQCQEDISDLPVVISP